MATPNMPITYILPDEGWAPLLARCLPDQIAIPDGLLVPTVCPKNPGCKVLRQAA